MTDIVVTVSRRHWQSWLQGGCEPGRLRSFHVFGDKPPCCFGDRLYVLAHNRIRCRLIVDDVQPLRGGWMMFARFEQGMTVRGATIRGFKGWQRRWWRDADEIDFPEWRTAGLWQFAPWAEAVA